MTVGGREIEIRRLGALSQVRLYDGFDDETSSQIEMTEKLCQGISMCAYEDGELAFADLEAVGELDFPDLKLLSDAYNEVNGGTEGESPKA